jgi:hypothetical protein
MASLSGKKLFNKFGLFCLFSHFCTRKVARLEFLEPPPGPSGSNGKEIECDVTLPYFMKFFIDSANLEQIENAQRFGLLDGVTTNPSLMAKEGVADFDKTLSSYMRYH